MSFLRVVAGGFPGWLVVERQRAPRSFRYTTGGSLTLDLQPPQSCSHLGHTTAALLQLSDIRVVGAISFAFRGFKQRRHSRLTRFQLQLEFHFFRPGGDGAARRYAANLDRRLGRLDRLARRRAVGIYARHRCTGLESCIDCLVRFFRPATQPNLVFAGLSDFDVPESRVRFTGDRIADVRLVPGCRIRS